MHSAEFRRDDVSGGSVFSSHPIVTMLLLSVAALLATAPTSWEYKDPEGGATVVFSALVDKGRARRLSAGRRSGGDGD